MNAENYAADDVSGVSLWRGGWFDVYRLSELRVYLREKPETESVREKLRKMQTGWKKFE